MSADLTPLYVVGGYLALLIGLGLVSRHFFRGTSSDYFVATRSIGPFLLLMSLFGTTMTAFALVGSTGKAYDLGRFVDPRTVFISGKSHDGRPLLALERPGLWNGSMAWWNTVFVEVPAVTFAPVKTVFDLLQAEHQA